MDRVDRYIFGHKNGRFDSPIKFYVHFKHLMGGGQMECGCVKCVQSKSQRVSLKGGSGVQRGLPVPLLVQEEISERVSSLIRTTYNASNNDPTARYVTEQFGNEVSLDKLHDGIRFGTIVEKYQNQPSFLPRKGELVLFYIDTEPNCELYFEEPLQHLKIYSHSSNRSLGYPEWKAAVICNEPIEKLDIEDLEHNRSGFQLCHDRRRRYKLEIYEDQGQTHEVPLSYIRPLSIFHELLSGLEQADWHGSILNALRKMNTACVVDPLMFFGEWPRIAITFNGAWLGSELFIVGDVVRIRDGIRPAGCEVDEGSVLAVRIHQIAWEFCLKGCDDIVEEPQVMKIRGEVLRICCGGQHSRRSSNGVLEDINSPASARSSLIGYDWFKVESANSLGYMDLAASSVLGRLYEARAMEILTGSRQITVGSWGVEGAREYAGRQSKGDILSDEYMTARPHHWNELNWLLSKDRIEALQLHPHCWRRWNQATLSALWIDDKQEILRDKAEKAGKDEESDAKSADVVAMEY
jgi:hypothetical protein